MEEIRTILKAIVGEVEFSDRDDLIEAGLLDSVDIMELVGELEDNFEIEISGRDIIPENFASVRSISILVKKYTGED